MSELQSNGSNPSYTTNQTIEVENAVIGALLNDGDLAHQCNLSVESFYTERNRMIYKAIRTLTTRNEPIDMVSISMEIGTAMDGIGVDNLIELMEIPAVSKNFEFYTKKVKEFYMERLARKLSTQHADGQITTIELLNGLADLDVGEERNSSKMMKEVLNDVYADMQLDKDEISGIKTGFPELDRILDGLQGGDLIVIGARPAMGKTAFVMNIAGNISDGGNGVSLFNYEMMSNAIGRRLIGSATMIETSKLRNGKRMTERDWDKFSMYAGEIANRPLMIHEASGWTARDVRVETLRDIKKMKAENHVVIVDYLQLVTAMRDTDNANAKATEISRELKLLAKKHNVPVIVLSQLSRQVEQRQDKRPLLSDLRDSGAIEQDADVVLMLYRDEYYNAESEDANSIEVIVRKQRDGDLGSVKLMFRKEFGKILSTEDMGR